MVVSMAKTQPKRDDSSGNGSPPPEAITSVGTPVDLESSPTPTEHMASFHPGSEVALPPAFSSACERLSTALGCPLWLLVQNTFEGPANPPSNLGHIVRDAFFRERQAFASDKRIALIIDSPGGYARCAYEIARMLQRHCESLTTVVPRYAKSAATLLALSAPIMLGADAELGPLDAQIWDADREEQSSALNEVQALERLHSQAVDEVDQMVPLLVGRTGKKVERLLPLVLDFVANMKRPLLEKIDTVHYTQQSRVLKEAEDYALRLLTASGLYPSPRDVVARLVNRYSDHGFVIDREEACEFLHVVPPTNEDAANAMQALADYLTDNPIIAIGRFNAK